MLTASAIAAQERTHEEVQDQESEDSEDKYFTGEEEQQDNLESDIAEGELIEEQETMEETFNKLTITTPKKTPKNKSTGFKEVGQQVSFLFTIYNLELSNVPYVTAEYHVFGGSSKSFVPRLVKDVMVLQIEYVIPTCFLQKGQLIASHGANISNQDHVLTEFKHLCDHAKHQHAADPTKPKYTTTQIVALPFKCSSNEMEYELLAFASKDKEFVKEYGQAAVMFVFLVSLKAAKQPQYQKACQGITCKIEAINNLEDSLDEGNSHSEVAKWRMRASCCLIPPCHHLGGRMFGQMTSSRKFELLVISPPPPQVVSTFLL